MASWSSTGSINGNYKLELNVWESYIGTSTENYSTVNWEVILRSTGNYSFSTIGSTVVINVDGEVYNVYSQKSISAGGAITIASGSKNITHDDDGTKSIYCSATYTQSSTATYTPGNMSCNGTFELTKIPRYATVSQSLSSKTINTIIMKWTTNSTVDYIWYSKDNGSTWTGVKVTNGTSGTYTISGLLPATKYNIKTRVKRKDSQLTTDSSTLVVTTYDYAKITEASNVIIGNNTTIKYSNPAGASIQVGIYTADAQTDIASYRSVSGSSYTFNFTNNEINKIYAQIPSSTSISLRFYLKTIQNGVDYYHYVTRTFSIDLSANKPNFFNYEYEDIDTQAVTWLTDSNQTAINGVSDIKVTIPVTNKAIGKNYASMSKYRITIGNSTKEIAYSDSEDLSVNFINVKSRVILVAAIDSRGLETVVEKSLNWKPYTFPTFTKFEAYRENGVGTKVLFEIEGEYWNHNFGKVDNAIMYLFYQYRKKGENSFSAWINVTESIIQELGKYNSIVGSFFPTEANGTTAFEFELGTEYEIRFILKDKTDTENYSSIITINSGIPCTAKVKKSDGTYSMGVNKIPDENYAFDIDGNLCATKIYQAGKRVNLVTDIVTGTEFETGRVIDGKTEFGKRIIFGPLPNASGKIVSIGVSDVTYTKIEGIATNGNFYFKLPYVSPNATNAGISLYLTGNAIEIDTGIDRSSFNAIIEVRYIKN